MVNPLLCIGFIPLYNINEQVVTPKRSACDAGRAGSCKGIKYDVSFLGEELDEPRRQGYREDSTMILVAAFR